MSFLCIYNPISTQINHQDLPGADPDRGKGQKTERLGWGVVGWGAEVWGGEGWGTEVWGGGGVGWGDGAYCFTLGVPPSHPPTYTHRPQALSGSPVGKTPV